MKASISVIGAGRVGRTLARQLRLRGYRIGDVVAGSLRSARAAVKFIGGGRATKAIGEIAPETGIVLICTPDDRIAPVAASLARLKGSWRGKIVLHTSGALTSRELGRLKRRGASVGSMHPVFAFARALQKLPTGIVFGIEGTPGALQAARRLARALRGNPVRIAARDKALYHASAAMVAGHLMTLVDIGIRAMVKSGMTQRQARKALLPLVFGTVGNYSKTGADSWTGPLQRGDLETVRSHMVALRRLPPAHQAVYVSLARAALVLYKPPKGRAALQRALAGEGSPE